MSLVQLGPNVSLISSASTQRIFTYDAGLNKYTAPDDSYLVLTADAANKRFFLTDQTSNSLMVFNDFTMSNTALNGKLISQSTLQRNSQSLSGNTFSYNTNGTVNQITTSGGQDYSLVFTYSGTLITQIQVKDASNNLLQQVNYTYYQNVSSPSTDIGTSNDLVQVKVSTKATNDTSGTLSIVRYKQYRYGTGSLLKAVYEHDAIQRAMSSLTLSTPESLMTKADTFGSPNVKTFASRSFTYYSSNASTAAITTSFQANENLNSTYGGADVNETNFIASETINGCGSCSTAGSITTKYYYMGLNSGSTDQNVVVQLVVEDTVDAAGAGAFRQVLGLEDSGRNLRKVLIQNPITSPLYWCDSTKMATAGPKFRVAEIRYPSAHTGVTTAAHLRSFLNPYNGSSWANDTSTVNASSGVINTYSYNSNGYLTDTYVKKGSSGTAYLLAASDYGDSANPSLVTALYDYPSQTTTRSNGIQTTYSYTFYDSSTHQQVKTRTTTLPTISSTQNGSGVATTKVEYFDNLGRQRWLQDGEGYINYTSYHPTSGDVAYIALDVNPSSPGSDITGGSAGNWDAVTVSGASSNQPTRNSSLPAALALATKVYYDAQGRQRGVTDPNGATHFTAYSNTQTIQFRDWDSGTSKCLSPIQVLKVNDGGQPSDRFAVRASYSAISTTSGAPTAFSTSPGQSDFTSWQHNTYDTAGRLSYVDQYFVIPSSGAGTLSSNFYRTVTQYDALGRLQYVIEVIRGGTSNDRVEQVTQNVYDTLGRIVQTNAGVSGDASANSHDMTDNYNSYPTLRTTSQTIYDAGGVGDGHVTKTKKFFGTASTSYIGENFNRTYRGHLRGVEPFYVNSTTETALAPYLVTDIDWKGRTTTMALYSSSLTWATVLASDGYTAYASSTASNRLSRRDTVYDNLNRIYQRTTYDISSSSGSGSNYISDRAYYDRNDRLVASGVELATASENAYDGAGRLYQTRTVIALQSSTYSSGAFTYCAPTPHPSLSSMTGGNAGVLALTHSTFDSGSNVTETDVFENNHDDVLGSAVGMSFSTNDDYVRGTAFNWYDVTGKVVASADYGSGDTSSGPGQWKYSTRPSKPTTAPTSSSNTALTTLYAYNADSGLKETVTTPQGITNKLFYDRLGREQFYVENYSGFNPSTQSGTGGVTDRVTQHIYDGPSRLAQLVVLDPNGDGSLADNQVTRYLYEDPVDAALNTHRIFPDSSDTTSSGTNQLKMVYNVDGSLAERTDQRGNIIAYAYSNHRLPASESVSTVGSGVDGAVRSITYSCDSLLRPLNTTSWSGTSGTGTVVNDVQFAYNGLGLVTTTYQSHSGAASTGSPKVQYSYDTSVSGSVFSKQSRLQTLTYPDGRTVYFDYGAALGAYDCLSRAYAIRETNGSGTAMVTYEYNGAGTRLARSTLTQPSLRLDNYQGSSGVYAGLDRFGRTVDHLWSGFNSTGNADRIRYGHDYASNRVYRDIDSSVYSTNNMDEAYTFDALSRLTVRQQGTLASAVISGTPTTEEDWTLDGTSNSVGFVRKVAGTTTFNQGRTTNAANEITALSSSVGVTWATPAYDGAGNMTTLPKPLSPQNSFTVTYDAWNRMVRIVDTSSGNDVQRYQYDGRHFRTQLVSYSGGAISETRDLYYTNNWQCIEERVNGASAAERQFVWGARHIDELILRDRGTERLYCVQDSNFNVSAITNASGAVQERYTYNGGGEPTFLNASFGGISASAYAWETLFAGYRYDSSSGLYAVRHRVYQPGLEAWCQRDPEEYNDSNNLYAYCNANPVTRVDPSGLAWIPNIDYGVRLTAQTVSVIEQISCGCGTTGTRTHGYSKLFAKGRISASITYTDTVARAVTIATLGFVSLTVSATVTGSVDVDSAWRIDFDINTCSKVPAVESCFTIDPTITLDGVATVSANTRGARIRAGAAGRLTGTIDLEGKLCYQTPPPSWTRSSWKKTGGRLSARAWAWVVFGAFEKYWSWGKTYPL